jgi:hypothetical protein
VALELEEVTDEPDAALEELEATDELLLELEAELLLDELEDPALVPVPASLLTRL